VLKAAYPDFREERSSGQKPPSEAGWYSFAAQAAVMFHADSVENAHFDLPIRSIAADLPVHFAPDGGAVPGDRIVGILTNEGQAITIYPIQSPALAQYEGKRDLWLDVRWDIDSKTPMRFPAQISIQSKNEPGSLARIAQAISDTDGNIDNIRMARRTPDFHEIVVDLEVWDLKHLISIIDRVGKQSNVGKVERING
jgi:GTP diphosphokinase / guanosine-3',5'-bis(diphosphate) 3'-diphosphatase